MGVGLSLIIGLVTFTVGVSLFPVEPATPPSPPAGAPIAAPPVVPPTPSGSDAGSDAGGDAGRSTDGADANVEGGPGPHDGDKDSSTAAPTGAPAATGPAPRRPKTPRDTDKEKQKEKETAKEVADASPAEDATTGAGGESGATTASGDDTDGGTPVAPAADCTMSDKDIAREAWRHNWPTICAIPDSSKAFILIPVKGSIEKAVVELKRKPVREARVTVPTGESLLTLKLYKLHHLGFKDLKIGPADDGPGTRFRVRLMNGAGDPVFDVKDGYAKITVASPQE